jgi:flagellar biosynthesis protein FliP
VALILTLLVMRPIGDEIWSTAFVPYDQDKIGLETALQIAEKPISRFMLAQTSKAACSRSPTWPAKTRLPNQRSTPSPSSWRRSCCPS